MWREIKKVIEEKQNFVITTHLNPDGDGIGSGAALIELLLMMGKKARFVCEGAIPAKFNFLDFHQLFEQFDPIKEYSDEQVVIVIDTHHIKRTGRMQSLINQAHILSICIDHHQITDPSHFHYNAIDQKASSSGSMIHSLFKELGFFINLEAALGLYTSIICDTGRFCTPTTDRKAHKIAAECIKKGVDPEWVYMHLLQPISLSEYRMLAKILDNMEIHCEDRVIVQQLCKKDYEAIAMDCVDVAQWDVECVHEFNKRVVGIECAVLLREMPDGRVRISIRSHSTLAVDKIGQKLGGGGHQKAAGAIVNGPINRVKHTVLQLLEKTLDTSPS